MKVLMVSCGGDFAFPHVHLSNSMPPNLRDSSALDESDKPLHESPEAGFRCC